MSNIFADYVAREGDLNEFLGNAIQDEIAKNKQKDGVPVSPFYECICGQLLDLNLPEITLSHFTSSVQRCIVVSVLVNNLLL